MFLKLKNPLRIVFLLSIFKRHLPDNLFELFLVLAKLQDYGVKIYITAYFVPIFAGIVLLMIFFGYLEDMAGFYREEARIDAKRNPYFLEIIERLEKIEKKLSKR